MNTVSIKKQVTIAGDDYILVWVDAFLKERKAQNLSKGTIKYYRINLRVFSEFLDSQEVKFISQITPNVIRDFLLILEDRGHNPGGIHGYFRAIKAFLRWYWDEMDIETANPISKVKSPKVPVEAIEGVSKEDFDSLVAVCNHNFYGERDKAILMVLYDTGIRASELCNLNMEDIFFTDSTLLIQQGKGRKFRQVVMGKSTRKQLRKYLTFRGKEGTALYINRFGERVSYITLRQVVRRLALKAGIKEPGLHDFRRAFALESLRKGIDLLTLSRLMGHTTLQMLSRYTKQTTLDLINKYKSPIDD